jgi:hypothetical protein
VAKKLKVSEPAYIAVSNLARVRAIQSILGDILDVDAGAVTEAELRHVRQCLDAWVARLEFRLGAVDADDGPALRKWPGPTR